MSKAKIVPSRAKGVGTDKKAASQQSPSSGKDKQISWSISMLDVDGPFCWSKIGTNKFWSEIIPKIKHLESQSYLVMINDAKHHNISIDKLTKQARDRLEEIRLDDCEELFSIRLSGKERIFCIQQENVMKILWWDPDHLICPCVKKHT